MLVLDNVRSAHNVGAILRTAEGLGLQRVVLCGLTPRPRLPADKRLPHIIAAAEHKIFKTSLGAERHLQLVYAPQVVTALRKLSGEGYHLLGLELTKHARDLRKFRSPNQSLVLVVGHERQGLSSAALKQMDDVLMIPMRGNGRSFNVATATAMALYQLAQ